MTETPQALVTGASSGIGLCIAKNLIAEGYRVTGISRRGDVRELTDPQFTPLSLDLTDTGAIENAFAGQLAKQTFDCFIHAAGAGHFGSIEQFSTAQINASIQLNLLSAMILCRSLVPGMRRRHRGRVVFIGSESALSAGKKGSLYSAAKFGLRGFSQALREDCASDGILVSLVNPGMVRSPFFDQQSFAPGSQPENAISPEDVASLVMEVLKTDPNLVVDEINLSPRVKSIDFKPGR